jgi:hypothetical protein
VVLIRLAREHHIRLDGTLGGISDGDAQLTCAGLSVKTEGEKKKQGQGEQSSTHGFYFNIPFRRLCSGFLSLFSQTAP